MHLSEEKLNLVQKLAKIRAISDVVSKEKRGYNYSYADITTILANITAGMKKYRVSLIPSIVPGTFNVSQNVIENTKVDKTGKPYVQKTTEMLVQAEMIFKWINDDEPTDYIEVPWVAVGSQNDPSMATGSSLTYCTRYFLTSFFQIAQADSDVDAYRSKQKAAEVSEDKAIATAIIEQFDATLRQYLADNPGKQDDIKKFVSGRFVKSGNYKSITDPKLASKLLEEFNNKYINAEKGE